MYGLKVIASSTAAEAVNMRFNAVFGGMESLQARFRTYSFDAHAHEEYVIALVLEGAEAFRCRGKRHVATAGTLYTIDPGEEHDGAGSGPQGWSYLAIYPSPSLVQHALEGRAPRFRRLVWRDATATRRLLRLHALLDSPDCSLAKESALLDVLERLSECNGGDPKAVGSFSRAPLRQVRAALTDDFTEKHSLESLGRIAGLHPNYLLAIFKQEFGMTPAHYLRMRRLSHAKRLIRAEVPLKTVAQEAGFYDQPHFARTFKRAFGIAPSSYVAAIRHSAGIGS